MARRAQLTLLSNASATGSGVDWPGGRGMFFAEGTFGGGSVAIEQKTPNGTWVPIYNTAGSAISASAAGGYAFEAPAGQIRAKVATATAVYAYAVGIPTNNGG